MPPNRQYRSPRLDASSASGVQGWSNMPGWNTSQNDVARQGTMYLIGGGLSKAGAAGVVGNWMAESSLTPSEPGGGLAQWIGARYTALQSFAANLGKPVTSVEAQAKFELHELKTGYPKLFTMLSQTNDPAKAALAIVQQYERPAGTSSYAARQQYAQLAYTAATGLVATAQGSGGNSSGGSGGSAPSSVLDILTSPVSTIGGWLASIAVTIIKDTAEGIGDFIIVPFWHWQQRTVAEYTNQLFGDSSWPMLPWTAAFWGLGYFLLFTDGETKNLLPQFTKPVEVASSPVGNAARTIQAVPARTSLIKPKHVSKRTPKKPKPRLSTVRIKQVGTLSTNRPQTVRVTGRIVDNGRRNSRGETSLSRIEGKGRQRARPAARKLTHSTDRARHDSLSNRPGHSSSGKG